MLLISACAVRAGARSYAAIAEYAHDSGRDVLDQPQVGRVTAATTRPSRESRRVLALDGKTVRGARRLDGSRVHVVAVFDLASGAVLAQRGIASKGGEVAVVPGLLDELELADVLVTVDALHTQRGHADYLHSRGAHYLTTVKANQPRLLHRLRALP